MTVVVAVAVGAVGGVAGSFRAPRRRSRALLPSASPKYLARRQADGMAARQQTMTTTTPAVMSNATRRPLVLSASRQAHRAGPERVGEV